MDIIVAVLFDVAWIV